MVKCLEDHRITFSFLIIRALLVSSSCLNQMICAPALPEVQIWIKWFAIRAPEVHIWIKWFEIKWFAIRAPKFHLNQMICDKMICDTRSEVPNWTNWLAKRALKRRPEPIDSRNALWSPRTKPIDWRNALWIPELNQLTHETRSEAPN